MTSSRVEAFYRGSGPDQRFTVLWTPASGRTTRGSVLFIQPWGEELNKSRRMVAQAARSLAAKGWSVARFDLYGTGDSPGELADASWEQWSDDIVQAFDWLRSRDGQEPVLWAMRAGALLLDAARPRLPRVSRLLLWQPVTSGAAHLTQFLRLRVAADALAGGSAGATTRSLIEQLRGGQLIEVAGYPVPPALAVGLHDARWLGPWTDAQIDWMEIDIGDPPTMSPAAAAAQQKMRSEGSSVRAQVVHGPPFWQTQELEDCVALVEATTAALCGHTDDA